MSLTAFGQPSATYGDPDALNRVGVAPGTVTLELPDGSVVGLIDYNKIRSCSRQSEK